MMMGVGLHNMNQIREDDIMYNSLPLYHVTGGIGGVGQAILCGTSVVIRKKFSASEFWSDCIKYNVTVALYLGELLRYLLAQPPSPKEKMHKLRLICGNGLRAKIWQEVMDRFNIPAIGEVYGSTEGNCSMCKSLT
jgi:solute carrier family 27 fatty acid transporter 1/4